MITATSTATKRELIPAGNYIARCYQMIHIGEIMDTTYGRLINKAIIGWELPTELKVFRQELGEQPYSIRQEFTLSLNEKANLRKLLASWRGKDFTEAEAKAFDITALIGKACMLNIIHKHSASGSTYEYISSISPLPKGIVCPPQINESFILDYDNFSEEKFNVLPDFIKDKIKNSLEYAKMKQPAVQNIAEDLNGQYSEYDSSDLPF